MSDFDTAWAKSYTLGYPQTCDVQDVLEMALTEITTLRSRIELLEKENHELKYGLSCGEKACEQDGDNIDES